MSTSQPLVRALATAVVALVASLAAPFVAHAAPYEVAGTCGNYDVAQDPYVAAFAEGCSTLQLRNSGGPGNAPEGAMAVWVFNAPPGTVIVGFNGTARLGAGSGWQSALYAAGGGTGTGAVVENCPGDTCPGGSKELSPRFYGVGGRGTQLVARVRCGASGGCPRDRIHATLSFNPFQVVLDDPSAPAVSITGGGLADGRWRSGTQTVDYNATDNTGIRKADALLGHDVRGGELRPCQDGVKVPCSNASGTLVVPTTQVSDGEHPLTVRATDAAGNVGLAGVTARIDNTAPASPLELTVDESWRRDNALTVTFKAPPQDHAPIDGLAYRLCPTDTPVAKQTGCSELQTEFALKAIDANDAAAGQRVEGIELPKPGAYQARFMLRDAAGNVDESTALIRTVRFDPDAPRLTFLGQDPSDPVRLRISASDATSEIAAGEVEVQRVGDSVWRPLAVEPSPDGFTAFMDDAVLPKGEYVLRARARDAAGNEASTDRRDDGSPATMKLPVRLPSRLDVGAKGRRSCRGRGKRRTCRNTLRSKLHPRYGRSVRLHGRLFVGREPVRGTVIEVWRRTKLPGAGLERVATVRTSKTGRFSTKAARGPARLLRFRFPGSAHVRSDEADVSLGVRGVTTFRPSRKTVVNGDYVTFRGRVRGAPLPPTGKLVELQVYTRRKWRTFAQPRTDATGRWRFDYRFEEIRRTTRIRFRARLREEAGYPYDTGTSGARRVTVRGAG